MLKEVVNNGDDVFDHTLLYAEDLEFVKKAWRKLLDDVDNLVESNKI